MELALLERLGQEEDAHSSDTVGINVPPGESTLLLYNSGRAKAKGVGTMKAPVPKRPRQQKTDAVRYSPLTRRSVSTQAGGGNGSTDAEEFERVLSDLVEQVRRGQNVSLATTTAPSLLSLSRVSSSTPTDSPPNIPTVSEAPTREDDENNAGVEGKCNSRVLKKIMTEVSGK